MPTVFIPSQLRELTGGVSQINLDAATVRQVIAALEERFPGIRDRLCKDDGIVPGLSVSVDGALVSKGMLSPVKATSEVHFLPAIGGG